MNVGHRSHNGWSSGSSSGLTLHHVVGPQNLNELKYVHEQAEHTAIIYISTIIILYIFGLIVILFHHMNQTHGVWAWNCLDVWDELRPWSSPPTSNTLSLSDGTSTKQGIEIVIESAFDDSLNKPKKKWKHKKKLFFFKSKETSNMDNSNSHYNHNSESSCYHTKESREDSVISDSMKVKDVRGMSVVTILDDEHHRGRQSQRKSQVLETAL